MVSRADLEERLAIKKTQLESAYAAYTALLGGQVKSYTIGSRNLTKFDLPQLEDSIRNLENEIEILEERLHGGGKRKAVGVVPRDF